MKDIIYITLIVAAAVITWLLTPKAQTTSIIRRVNRIEVNSVSYMLALDEIRKYEGLRLEPYDYKGNWYIGYGHLIKKREPLLHNGITEQEAEAILNEDLDRRIIYAHKRYNVVGDKALALAMLIYNLGDIKYFKDINGVRHVTTVHKMLSGWIPFDDHAFRVSWISFCKIDGKENRRLRERREFEMKLWFNEKLK